MKVAVPGSVFPFKGNPVQLDQVGKNLVVVVPLVLRFDSADLMLSISSFDTSSEWLRISAIDDCIDAPRVIFSSSFAESNSSD